MMDVRTIKDALDKKLKESASDLRVSIFKQLTAGWCIFCGERKSPAAWCTCSTGQLLSSKNMDTEFSQSPDARVWYNAFRDTKANHPNIEANEGALTTWFANLLEKGKNSDPSVIKAVNSAYIASYTPHPVFRSNDASVWAKEFVKLRGELPKSERLALGWFAFALIQGTRMQPLTWDQAQKDALRTDLSTNMYPKVLERMQAPGIIQLVHACMGLSTEIGELQEALKKHLFYGKPLDFTNLIEEAGDLSWYLRLLSDCLKGHLSGNPFEEIIKLNIAKLRARYPDKFTESDALNRDLGAERSILEKKGQNYGASSQIMERIGLIQCSNCSYSYDPGKGSCPRCS